jgi:hypothetical protein
MKQRLIVLVTLALLASVVLVGNAVAAAPPMTPAEAQAMGQQAKSGQDADTTAGSGQYQPSNQAAPVRIGSKGDGGDVTQTNASAAAAVSANENKTDQSAEQTQAGGSGGSYGQAAGQEAKSEQDADSKAESTQTSPRNVNVPIRILSPGDDGDVTQTNASAAGAASANGNKTDQSVDQSQGSGSAPATAPASSCGCSDASYSQAAGQEAKNDQDADSKAESTQKAPSNVNVPIRIGSRGEGGDVTQTNASLAGAVSANGNKTDQSVDQTQSGGSGSRDSKCCSDASYSQAAGQESKSEQSAESDAKSTQKQPSNINVPIRILSPGDDGDVTQTNASAAGAASLNGNKTDQSVDQTQSGKGGSCCSDASYSQAAGQEAKNDQWADSDADSKQEGASNVNVPVRIGSKGDDGDVTQTNASAALAASLNGNKTDQSVDQSQGGRSMADGRSDSKRCGCSSDALYLQDAGQEAKNEQGARSNADSTQKDASNVNAPVRIGSKGDGGDVTQTNASLAAAISANGNKAEQSIDQDQGGSGSGHGGDALYVQAAGQEAKSEQGARSDADSTQKDASNVNAPVRIGSKGDGGDVTQTNLSAALAASLNGNHTDQSVEQEQSGRSKHDPKCGCGSDAIYVQASGQEAKNDQWADSEADSTQKDATNTNVPVRIGSKGDDGDVTQTNLSAALAASLNGNKTDQSLDQTQGGSKKADPKHDPKCGCSDDLYIQAAGQEAKNDQWADSRARSDQHGASNVWDPVRIGSKGGHGDVTQTNASLVAGISASGNKATQHGSQVQSGSGTAEQTLGQSTGSKQKAGSDARSKQGKPKSKKTSKPYGGRHLDD